MVVCFTPTPVLLLFVLLLLRSSLEMANAPFFVNKIPVDAHILVHVDTFFILVCVCVCVCALVSACMRAYEYTDSYLEKRVGAHPRTKAYISTFRVSCAHVHNSRHANKDTCVRQHKQLNTPKTNIQTNFAGEKNHAEHTRDKKIVMQLMIYV